MCVCERETETDRQADKQKQRQREKQQFKQASVFTGDTKDFKTIKNSLYTQVIKQLGRI